VHTQFSNQTLYSYFPKHTKWMFSH